MHNGYTYYGVHCRLGQGHTTKQLHCDLNEDQSAACFGNEPVTSHGMRPARGWVALEIGLVRVRPLFFPPSLLVNQINYVVDYYFSWLLSWRLVCQVVGLCFRHLHHLICLVVIVIIFLFFYNW